MYYYYCPKCGYETLITKIPRNSMGNCRDGFGVPIHHSECPNCGNLDAGCMYCMDNTNEEKQYYRSVIGMYQGIRSK